MRIGCISVLAISVILAGCSSAEQRMASCQAKGVSLDTCYMAEQNRKTAYNAAAQEQAFRNSQKLAQSLENKKTSK